MNVSVRDLSRRVKRLFRMRDPDRFLKSVSGVVHVGANVGQERHKYAALGLSVVWIEPIPEVFAELERNLQGFADQVPYNCLITDRAGICYDFHIASNGGASSSILEMHQHTDVWPDVRFERSITLRSETLSSFFERESIAAAKYDALILDTQGAELLILRGAESLLPHFRYVKVEVPSFESYAGCCQLGELSQFMLARGYREFARHEFAVRKQGGSYFDVVYEREAVAAS